MTCEMGRLELWGGSCIGAYLASFMCFPLKKPVQTKTQLFWRLRLHDWPLVTTPTTIVIGLLICIWIKQDKATGNCSIAMLPPSAL